jgi:hypothetical protein
MTEGRAVPWLQSVYDLMCADAAPDPEAVEAVAEWSRRTRLTLPGAVREFYTTTVRIPIVRDEGDPAGAEDFWTLSLPELWREYSGGCRLSPLAEVLAGAEEARAGRDPMAPPSGTDRVEREPPVPGRGPLVHFERDVHAACHDFFELGRSDDPAVFVHSRDGRGEPVWSRDRETFSDWMLDWFASYYRDDMTPYSFFGPDADPECEEEAPALPYGNGLWARALDRPISASAVAELSRRHGEPSRQTLPGGAHAYCWRPPSGVIRVTTDTRAESGAGDGRTGGVSAWWVHGGSPDGFRELLESVRHHGDLARRLRNSPLWLPESAEEVLGGLRDAAADGGGA